ncbi:TPA: hypothetical protein ACSTJ0_003297 [Serratia fonticola]
MNVEFIIDERWLINAINTIDNSSTELIELCELIDEINKKRSSSVLYTDKIYDKRCGDNILCEVIFGELSMNPSFRDDILRINTLLGQSDTASVNPSDNNFDSDALNILSSWGHGALVYNQEVTVPWWAENSMHLVDKNKEIEKYYRIKSINESISFDEHSEYLDELYPSLYFLPEATELSRLGVRHETSFPTIIKHLSYLNDNAQEHYIQDRNTFSQVASTYGVILSGESSNTRGNHKANRERYKKIGDVDVKFELHTKVNWDKGRIHFHIGKNLPAEVSVITQDKLIVGIVCEHLPT